MDPWVAVYVMLGLGGAVWLLAAALVFVKEGPRWVLPGHGVALLLVSVLLPPMESSSLAVVVWGLRAVGVAVLAIGLAALVRVLRDAGRLSPPPGVQR